MLEKKNKKQPSTHKYLPIDVSTFSTMIEGNYIYVDKTEYIYNLFNGGNRYYFLSRPRRFGKSLLISTLKELFLGNRKLFKDTWIYKSNYKWAEHPVIHLDLSMVNRSNPEQLCESLSWQLQQIATHYNLSIQNAPTVHDKLSSLIMQLAQRNKVVVLIDEYDKPILDHLTNLAKAEQMRTTLMGIYDILKGMDAYLRAIFITGVTKFAKTSIFSGLNNLNDITMDKNAAGLLGYTKEELEYYFAPYIVNLAQEIVMPLQETYELIKKQYDGYRFTEKELYIYNPFSVLYCLSKKQLSNYWFESGTPSFLIPLLKEQGTKIKNIETVELSSSALGTFDINALHIFPILFQTGYLTIHTYHKANDQYILGYPNNEVKNSFVKYLISVFVEKTNPDIEYALNQFKHALDINDISLFCITLKSILANIPYQLHIGNEEYYHSLLQFLVTMLGLKGHSEISSSKGRIDMVLETEKHITIFEFKYSGTGKNALQQIIKQKYYEKYMHLKKPITLVGLSFNIKEKKLELDWIAKEMSD